MTEVACLEESDRVCEKAVTKMTANATNLSKNRMDCARVAREEIVEGYLLDRLSEGDREAFEEHCFGCGRCFDELQTLPAIPQFESSRGFVER